VVLGKKYFQTTSLIQLTKSITSRPSSWHLEIDPLTIGTLKTYLEALLKKNEENLQNVISGIHNKFLKDLELLQDQHRVELSQH